MLDSEPQPEMALHLRSVGFERQEVTCYVSTDCFSDDDDDPFADFVVHEAAHVFHNWKRNRVGLPQTRYQEWLLPIDFAKREEFAELVYKPTHKGLHRHVELIYSCPEASSSNAVGPVPLRGGAQSRASWRWCSIQGLLEVVLNPVPLGGGAPYGSNVMTSAWLYFPLFGSVAGLIAGLLGVGGGVVVVPGLVFLFTLQGYPNEHLMQTALGTSLGTIVFTSLSSLRAHHARGAVRWPIVLRITPGILLGTLGGAYLAAQMSTTFLRGFFACFLYAVAIQLGLGIQPGARRDLPAAPALTTAGGLIGVVSSLVGIGGGSLSVPFLTWCSVPMRHAIGTSAAIGLPIALAGSLGYALNGLGTELPGPHMGFLYLPALAGIAIFSVPAAVLGARLAHRLPVATLRRVFALFLLVVATRMLWKLVWP